MSGSRGPKVALVVIVAWCFLAMFTMWTRTSRNSEETESRSFAEHGHDRKLAVIVPIHEGDSDRAMEALTKWPTTCYSNTLLGMDLIIYKAETISSASLPTAVPDRASLCFRNTKIVSANLRPEISNIGFFDVNDHHVEKAISQDTLFIHGNSRSTGSVTNARKGDLLGSHHGRNNCTDACDAENLSAIPGGVSTSCDESCSAEWSSAGPRLGGYNCGAGNTSRYGSNCRLCYTDQEGALAADIKLGLSSVNTSAPKSHVIMCDTGHPPPAASCSAACEASPDTPVVTKVLEPSEDLKNTHTYNEKKVSKSPKRYT
ncbi:unnamed protein product [Ectocarpus sp. CCAP 1310/34]|nr:unnamed protein product [Ectocarpus sp. CCAP 1310/34]